GGGRRGGGGGGAPPLPTDDWHLRAEFGTDLPVQVGGHITLEMPYRLRFSTSFGYLPAGYVGLINAIAVAAGGYDQNTADLIDETLSSSFVWRAHFGWRPFRHYGFYFEAGYGLARLGGGAAAEEVIAAAAGTSRNRPKETGSYGIKTQIHMIDAEIGYEWILWKHVTIRAAVGFAGTVGAATSISPPSSSKFPKVAAEFARDSEAYLDDVFTSYVFTPVVSVAAGWRFF
ncbi:MAG: hypothetical protein FJ087_20945, partial [Deltaproteobacteria bacterium]|nr:hypothetical protein [Deltaproteobacteria bacterium]